MRLVSLGALLLVALLVAGCGADTTGSTAPKQAPYPTSTHLPVGDGQIATKSQAGAVFACATSFSGGGAHTAGAWISDDGTYNPAAKPHVDGAVVWPHRFDITIEGNQRVLRGNLLPNHKTGVFPIAPDDDAIRYDRNPNQILSHTLELRLPLLPTVADEASCLPMGAVGVLRTGSVFFNALDAQGRDAAAHEILDQCEGHPEHDGIYHYHTQPTCLADGGSGHGTLIGYALDGFGLFSSRGEDGGMLSNADLDACHGHSHRIAWDGPQVELYHYHATPEYPYLIGCFRGVPVQVLDAAP